jgi:hypothetical protein
MNKLYFGRALRAAQLGFFWSHRHRCFVRLSVIGPELFRVELLGETAEPRPTTLPSAPAVWTPDLLEESPALRRLAESGPTVSGLEIWLLDGDGESVTADGATKSSVPFAVWTKAEVAEKLDEVVSEPRALRVTIQIDGEQVGKAFGRLADHPNCRRCGHPYSPHEPARGACSTYMPEPPR